MLIFDVVKRFLSGESKTLETPENACPNCWGKQEYGGRFLEAVEQQKIDLNNLNAKKGWIQEYAVRHFEGIKVDKTRDQYSCPMCKVSYTQS